MKSIKEGMQVRIPRDAGLDYQDAPWVIFNAHDREDHVPVHSRSDARATRDFHWNRAHDPRIGKVIRYSPKTILVEVSH